MHLQGKREAWAVILFSWEPASLNPNSKDKFQELACSGVEGVGSVPVHLQGYVVNWWASPCTGICHHATLFQLSPGKKRHGTMTGTEILM